MKRTAPLLLLVILSTATAQLPKPLELNPHVLAIIKTYPTDGTHPYHWPKEGDWRGCTRDLHYGGEVLCKGDPDGRAYCCGLTFEVFLRAFERWCRVTKRPYAIPGFDPAGMRRLQSQWFGSSADQTCLRTALVDNGLGTQLENLDDARPGDFVQLWRHDGSGHSVIFMNWKRRSGKITGLEYWSTQKSTKGIGIRTEMFGGDGKAMRRDKFYLCRVGVEKRGE